VNGFLFPLGSFPTVVARRARTLVNLYSFLWSGLEFNRTSELGGLTPGSRGVPPGKSATTQNHEPSAIELGETKLTDAYHNLAHYGKSEAKLAQLKAIAEWHMRLLADLFTELKQVREDGETLLDRTMVLYGSNLGNANTHVTTDLPTLFAGGGFNLKRRVGFYRRTQR